MATSDELIGIAGNRIFMDNYYFYFKYKDEIASEDNEINGEQNEINSCKHYLSALTECVTKINRHSKHDNTRDYLDFIRWNQDIFDAKLSEYKNSSKYEQLLSIVLMCENWLKVIKDMHFKLWETEKAVVNQYVHAYERASREEKQHQNVYLHCGRLYINYINLLKNRYYIHSTGREGVIFSQLDAEALYLINKLQNINKQLAIDIEEANDMYANFRYQDTALRKVQYESIKDGLKLAHARASETFIENAIRHINETINIIMKKLKKNINKVWNASSVLFDPIRHPIESIQRLGDSFSHPMESAKAIYNYALEHPWKVLGIAICGVTIGFCSGVPIAIGIAFAINKVFTSIDIANFTDWAFLGGYGAAFGTLFYVNAIASSKMVDLQRESEKMISELEKEKSDIIDAYDKEAQKIARQALYEEHIRETLRQAREMAEENVRQMRFNDQKAEQERQQQIDAMSEQQLNSCEQQMRITNEELVSNLRSLREELSQTRQRSRQIQVKLFKLREGLSVAESILQDIADKHELQEYGVNRLSSIEPFKQDLLQYYLSIKNFVDQFSEIRPIIRRAINTELDNTKSIIESENVSLKDIEKQKEILSNSIAELLPEYIQNQAE